MTAPITIPVVDAYTVAARQQGQVLFGLPGTVAPRDYEDNAVYDADVIVRSRDAEKRIATKVGVVPRILLRAESQPVPNRHFVILLDAVEVASAEEIEIEKLDLAFDKIDDLRARLT